jgi:hypothetical protein
MSKSMDERLAKCRLDAAAFDSVINRMVGKALAPPARHQLQQMAGKNTVQMQKHQARDDVGHLYLVEALVRGGKTARFLAFQDGTAFEAYDDVGMGAVDRSKWAAKEFMRLHKEARDADREARVVGALLLVGDPMSGSLK